MKHTTQSIFHMLAEKGKEHLDDKQGNNWEAVGHALAGISESTRDVVRLAYDFAECHNNRGFCAVLNWVFNLYESKYSEELDNIKWLLSQPVYKVNVTRNEDGTWEQKKYRMVVNFQEVKE